MFNLNSTGLSGEVDSLTFLISLCYIDGLVALCQHPLNQEPRSGTLFVFINRSKTMVRLLAYEENGYWLMTKRLSQGTYQGWPRAEEPVTPLQAKVLRQLLSNLLKSGS